MPRSKKGGDAKEAPEEKKAKNHHHEDEEEHCCDDSACDKNANIIVSPVEELRTKFVALLDEVHHDDLLYFKVMVNQLLEAKLEKEELKPKKPSSSEKKKGLKYLAKPKETLLGLIMQELRDSVPVNAEAPSEKIIIPVGPDYEGFTAANTVHVDSFLYEDDEAIDELCEKGKMSRSYCVECGSHNTKPLSTYMTPRHLNVASHAYTQLDYITHSASLSQLRFIFGPRVLGDIPNQVLVDVGSRLGAVLYTGHLMTKASKLIGIEINEWFAKLQQEFITKKFKMNDRVEVIQADVMTQKSVLEKADVVVMNNVFEFFEPSEKLSQLWQFIRSAVCKPGSVLLTIPALQESLEKAHVSTDMMKGWVKEIPLEYPSQGDDGDEELFDLENVHLYRVL